MLQPADKTFGELSVRLAAEPDFQVSLQDICKTLGCMHAVYHLAALASPGMDIPFVRATYSPDWIMRYIVRNYITLDPVLDFGLNLNKPFFWSDIPRTSAALEAFFEDAKNHGVGNCGYTIPISERGGKRAMFTINYDGNQEEFRNWAARAQTHLKDIAMILHRRALAEIGVDTHIPLLSRREIECLNWTAKGKDASSVAEILDISEHTVRDYLKSAKKKLSCFTIAQAVYEATRLKLIKD